MRWGYKPPSVFNYAVKFYPNALVMLWRRKAAQSLGTDGAPYSGWRRKEDIPGGAGGRPRHHSHGGINSESCFSFPAFCCPSNQSDRKWRWPLTFFFFSRCSFFWEHDTGIKSKQNGSWQIHLWWCPRCSLLSFLCIFLKITTVTAHFCATLQPRFYSHFNGLIRKNFHPQPLLAVGGAEAHVK